MSERDDEDVGTKIEGRYPRKRRERVSNAIGNDDTFGDRFTPPNGLSAFVLRKSTHEILGLKPNDERGQGAALLTVD